MSLLNLISKDAICISLKSTDKMSVITELIELLYKSGKIKNKEEALKDVLEREKKASTGIEYGVAIPHAKTSSVDSLCVAIGISKKGIDFNAVDGKLSHIFFLMLSPKSISGPHIAAIAEIAKFVKSKEIRKKLKNASSVEEIINIISQYENKEQSS